MQIHISFHQILQRGNAFFREGRSKKRSRSGIGCIGRSPRSYVFTPWNQRNHLCRNHSGVATGHSGCNRNSGGKFVLFNPVLFLPVTKKRVLTCPDGQYRLKRNRRIRKHQKKRYRRERKKRKKDGDHNRKRSRRTRKEAKGSKEVGKTEKRKRRGTRHRRRGKIPGNKRLRKTKSAGSRKKMLFFWKRKIKRRTKGISRTGK